MKAYELMKETFLRRPVIRLVHIAFVAFFGVLFLLPKGVFEDGHWYWGMYVFFIGGFVLPIAISSGIMGNDISAGRFSQMLSTPLRLSELYLWRLAGLLLQGLLHIAVLCLLVLVLGALTGKGNTEHLGLTIPLAWAMFASIAAFSTTVSTFVGRSANTLVLVLALALIGVIANVLYAYQSPMTDSFMWCVRNCLPPLELLLKAAERGAAAEAAWRFAHAMGLAAIYAAIGIVILNVRQYGRASE